jgi:hypothetical protein
MFCKIRQGIEVLPKNMFDSTFLFNKDSYHENLNSDVKFQIFSSTQLVFQKSPNLK